MEGFQETRSGRVPEAHVAVLRDGDFHGSVDDVRRPDHRTLGPDEIRHSSFVSGISAVQERRVHQRFKQAQSGHGADFVH